MSGVDEFQEAIRTAAGDRSLAGLATAHNLPRDAIRSVLVGHDPRLSRARALAEALGLEFYIGPPRGDPAPPNATTTHMHKESLSTEIADSIQSRIGNLEDGLHQIVRVIVDAGGDPIPDDLWPVLDERRKVASIPLLTTKADDTPPKLLIANDEGSLTLAFAEDVRAAAGIGETVFEEVADLRITIPRSVLPDWAKPASLICIRTAGDSMRPTLADGDILVLDRFYTEPTDGKIFIIHTDDGLVVKRLRKIEDGWNMASDNADYPQRPFGETDQLVGRLAWSGPLRTTEAHAGAF